ncbi:hypothetical protein SDC9_187421 [bioreactor metagenome]|uniref:HMA domain-containing protein n=1 Tax=bioreactor metagenome TaxID=1076179 RepID=A0A645HLT6_9ZZZZ
MPETGKKGGKAIMPLLVFSVPDMSCQHCVKRIREALSRAGVEADVSLETKTITTSANDPELIVRILDDAGYDALRQ